MSGLYKLTLSQARAGLQGGKFTSLDLVQSCLERIKATEPKINACINLLEEHALETAKTLDAQGPKSDMPLWGIPLTLKDLICLKGFPTTCGAKFLADFTPFYDAEVVERLKQAGAVIIAKTNMDEFAMGSTTESSYFGRTANPWNLGKVPGGSSGGSAASVAACQAFGSLGSDTGGSIRQPAAFCGCVGIKPTYGRVSRSGVVAFGSSFDQVGPLARTVQDAAMLLEVIAGPDDKDAVSARLDLFPQGLPAQNFTEAAAQAGQKDPSDSLKGLKLGVPKELWDSGLSPEVEEACRNMLARFEEAGAVLTPVALPHQKYAIAVYYIMASAEASTNLARFDGVRYGFRAEHPQDLLDLYTRSRTEGFGEEVRRRIMLGTFVLSSGYYDAYYRKAAQIRRLMRDDFDRALGHCDMLVAPTATRTAWDFGFTESDPLFAYKMDLLTVTLNLVGLPGLALPVGLGAESGMPVGLQFMGRPFDEAALIKVGVAAEKLAPALGMPRAVAD